MPTLYVTSSLRLNQNQDQAAENQASQSPTESMLVVNFQHRQKFGYLHTEINTHLGQKATRQRSALALSSLLT